MHFYGASCTIKCTIIKHLFPALHPASGIPRNFGLARILLTLWSVGRISPRRLNTSGDDMASPQDVLKMIADNDVKFVDFRFTDTIGKEQHVSVPVSAIDEDKLVTGQAFDGSSITGWKGIEASDMILAPDLDTANLDPFREEPTLILTCDVIEPSDGKGYERDPRSLARRADAYLKSSGLGDTAYF